MWVVCLRLSGAFCPDGTPCERMHSTCGGKGEGCNGIGPGADSFQSSLIIASQQMRAAAEIGGFNSSCVAHFLEHRYPAKLSPHSLPSAATATLSTRRPPPSVTRKTNPTPPNRAFRDFGFPSDSVLKLDGPVSAVHAFVDFESLSVSSEWSGLPQNVTLCKSAMGDA